MPGSSFEEGDLPLKNERKSSYEEGEDVCLGRLGPKRMSSYEEDQASLRSSNGDDDAGHCVVQGKTMGLATLCTRMRWSALEELGSLRGVARVW
jgi:hypothetical protein